MSHANTEPGAASDDANAPIPAQEALLRQLVRDKMDVIFVLVS
jgi:hypothetical protein